MSQRPSILLFCKLLWVTAAFLPFCLRADMQEVIPLHHTFSYRFDGVDLGTNWRGRGFDDSQWQTGQTLMGHEMPGIYFEPLSTFFQMPPSGYPPVTTYFRTIFNMPAGAPAAPMLVLTSWVDDGAVFYLNGKEVGRVGMPLFSAVQFGTFAQEGGFEGRTNVLTFLATNLTAESNVLAVEVHQVSTNSSDIVFGATLSYEIPTPISMLEQPQDVVTVSNASVNFQVAVAGSSPRFQWYRDMFKLVNRTNSFLSISNAKPTDAGNYFVIVTNRYGPAITSRVATLTVLKDTIPPEVLSAIVSADPSETNSVDIIFQDSSGMDAASLLDANNYRINAFASSNSVSVASAQSTGGVVRLRIAGAWDRTKQYWVSFRGVRDYVGNLIPENIQTPVQFTSRTHVGSIDSAVWSFISPPQEPAGWRTADYVEDPRDWQRGSGVFVSDSNEWEPCMGSRLTSLLPNVTHYFRTTFDASNLGGSVSLRIRHVLDDGAVFYLNGSELGRYNMPFGAIAHSTRANTNVADDDLLSPSCVLQTFSVSNLLKGVNLLAVEVHQSGDLDAAFGAELEIDYAFPKPAQPRLAVTHSNSLIQVWWPGNPWRLETKRDFEDQWTLIEEAPVPYSIAADASGTQFFRLASP